MKVQPMVAQVSEAASQTVGEPDLAGFELEPGAKVLNAGCGSGNATRELAVRHPSAQIEGCDVSDVQLKQAERTGGPARFFKSSLDAIDRPSETYDLVLCRDVLSLVPDPRAASVELLRVLKPGGRILAIEYDGILCNLFPATPPLRQMLRDLEQGLKADLRLGRKLPGLLDATGFDEIQWDVSAVSFQGAALVEENRRAEQRLAFAMPGMAKALGSTQRAEGFRRLYLEEMQGSGAVVFYNKFVVRARK